MAVDDRGLPPSEAVPLSTPADASSSRWRRFKNWSASQWAAIRPGPEARRGAVWGTLAAAAITVIIGGLYISTGFGYLFDFAFCILFAALIIPLIALIVALLLKLFRKLPLLATGCILGSCMIAMALWGLLGPPDPDLAFADLPIECDCHFCPRTFVTVPGSKLALGW